LSNDIFKDEAKMHHRAMKMQRNCHKCHTTVPSQKSENSKNSQFLFSFTALQYQLRGLLMIIITSCCLSTHTQKSQ